MKVVTDEKKIEEVLTRGVEDIFIKENLKKRLLSGEKLNIKLGFDPTGSKIHIGRAIVLRKLREFQKLGHQVIFIVGDFTAQIGDPSDKLEKRPMLKKEEIKRNLKTYKQQVGKIIDLSKAKFYYNSKWLKKLGFQEISELAESFSIQQMSARRNFKERFEKEEEVSLREFMYPLMQGYDSVVVKADVELGGFDQLFNLKAGRVIQKHYGQKEQDVLTCQMLEGTDGRKMSTSWDNIVSIVDEPKDMFGKIMSLKDELMVKYFLLCTDLEQEKINEIEKELNNGGKNPRDIKLDLAFEIVRMYHNEKEAHKAKESFINTFQKKEIPEDMMEVEGGGRLVDTIVENQIVESKSEFRRLVEEGAVSDLDTGEKIKDPNIVFKKETKLKIGKRRFVKIK